ncbi:class I SAM-dependent methyltransferase [Methanoregula sp.]|uniref:class I SAM-dependent methyltransferase n=1 Tax=Methanoregula sp. TaxID=2052170 RepID=UPI00263388A0|nr:class I SAM-dependent methyltransferase [Methanoregula sp.]MDD5142787.1 class I SAM-dependent methyltransferase [Methanoregula sp.]
MTDIDAIDWNDAWKTLDLKKRAEDALANCTDRWNDTERCRKFNRRAQENNWEHGRERIQMMRITPTDRVLDIGAGPGTLAIPLAVMVRHVTAVEPSSGMLECLHGNIAEQRITNITTLQKKWEDVDPATDLDLPYDVVVASYSLGVYDLRAALKKMDAVSSKYAYIFWFADMQSPRLQNYCPIWEDLFGVPPKTRHTPNIIFNLLGQMGIYANVEITRTDHASRFSSVDEAVADQQYDLGLTEERQADVLRRFLEKTLERQNGHLILKRKSYQAKIWWEKEL